jgi:HK97 gp10 family phage protein
MQIDRFDMTGGRELDAALARLGTEVATKIGVDAVREAGEALQEAWQRVAPSDPNRRPGRRYGPLRTSIKLRREGTDNANVIAFRVTTGEAFYAYFYEFGTAKQPARPTFRPMVESMKNELVSIQSATLRAGIEAAAQRGRSG